MLIFPTILAVLGALVAFGGFKTFRHRHRLTPRPRSPPTTPTLAAPVPDPTTIYAIGDLHGDAQCAINWVTSTGLLSNFNASSDPSSWLWSTPSSRLIFVGDYLDKGPTSLSTVMLVKSLSTRFPENVVALMGNHELEVLNDRLPREQRSRYWYQLPYSTVHPEDMLSYVPDSEITANTTEALDVLYELALEEIYSKNKFRSIDFSPYGPRSICNFIEDEGKADMVRREVRRTLTPAS